MLMQRGKRWVRNARKQKRKVSVMVRGRRGG
jgi:hypothetical protein